LPRGKRLLILLDHSLDVVELVGRDGMIEGVSKAIRKLGGYEPEELIGRHYQEIIHPDDCALAAVAFARVLNGQTGETVTIRYRRKDGAWRTVELTARNFLPDPAVGAVLILTRDVTELRAAEHSLADANLELRRLAQRLIAAREDERSHLARELHDDVQQILVGLHLSLGSSQRTHATAADTTHVGDWKGQIELALEHLNDLTQSLRPPVLEGNGLAGELSALTDRLSAVACRRITLDVRHPLGDLGEGVALACFRIAQEALANAIKHAGAQQLSVGLEQTSRGLVLSVHDNGSGFDMAAARAKAIDGRSIGLLTMRERASLVGARIAIRTSPGTGTEVTATFPAPGEGVNVAA
jgi:PAS domain S-box-containing protein